MAMREVPTFAWWKKDKRGLLKKKKYFIFKKNNNNKKCRLKCIQYGMGNIFIAKQRAHKQKTNN